ncbi:MAG: hypothetical protein WCQ16_11405 [Verrucomicrobiae bacterium]
MKRLRLILLVLTLLPALPSCAGKKGPPSNSFVSPVRQAPKPAFWQQWLAKLPNPFPKKQKPPAALLPQWTGVIRMVNSAEHFVLIESSAISSAVPGETYFSVAKGLETASLRMTSLKNPPFLIADIVSGSPSPGEKIYRPKTNSSPSAAPVASASPAAKPAQDDAKKPDPAAQR